MRIKLYFLALIVLGACNPTETSKEIQLLDQSEGPAIRENNIQAHRDFLRKEVESIKSYIEERKLDVQRNGTGIFYKIDSLGSGPNPIMKDEVSYHYKISMLNGALLYQSPEGEAAKLRIDREDAEIGLHEALKMMRVGDKGLFILPSHRAFGVAGDQNKVPPFTALVYELELTDIQKQNP